MIPEAAVEAVAVAIFQNQTGMDWESRSDVLKARFLGDARAALEAAHPVLLAVIREQRAKLDATSGALQQLMGDYNYSPDINYADLEALNSALTATEPNK